MGKTLVGVTALLAMSSIASAVPAVNRDPRSHDHKRSFIHTLSAQTSTQAPTISHSQTLVASPDIDATLLETHDGVPRVPYNNQHHKHSTQGTYLPKTDEETPGVRSLERRTDWEKAHQIVSHIPVIGTFERMFRAIFGVGGRKRMLLATRGSPNVNIETDIKTHDKRDLQGTFDAISKVPFFAPFAYLFGGIFGVEPSPFRTLMARDVPTIQNAEGHGSLKALIRRMANSSNDTKDGPFLETYYTALEHLDQAIEELNNEWRKRFYAGGFPEAVRMLARNALGVPDFETLKEKVMPLVTELSENFVPIVDDLRASFQQDMEEASAANEKRQLLVPELNELRDAFVPFTVELDKFINHVEDIVDIQDPLSIQKTMRDILEPISAKFMQDSETLADYTIERWINGTNYNVHEVFRCFTPIAKTLRDAAEQTSKLDPGVGEAATSEKPDYDKIAETFHSFIKKMKKAMKKSLEHLKETPTTGTTTTKTLTTEICTTETATPEASTPAAYTPETSKPKPNTPAAYTPQTSVPKPYTPAASAPKTSVPKPYTPAASTPKTSMPEPYTPAASTPKTSMPEPYTTAASTPAESTPKTGDVDRTKPVPTPKPHKIDQEFCDMILPYLKEGGFMYNLFPSKLADCGITKLNKTNHPEDIPWYKEEDSKTSKHPEQEQDKNPHYKHFVIPKNGSNLHDIEVIHDLRAFYMFDGMMRKFIAHKQGQILAGDYEGRKILSDRLRYLDRLEEEIHSDPLEDRILAECGTQKGACDPFKMLDFERTWQSQVKPGYKSFGGNQGASLGKREIQDRRESPTKPREMEEMIAHPLNKNRGPVPLNQHLREHVEAPENLNKAVSLCWVDVNTKVVCNYEQGGVTDRRQRTSLQKRRHERNDEPAQVCEPDANFKWVCDWHWKNWGNGHQPKWDHHDFRGWEYRGHALDVLEGKAKKADGFSSFDPESDTH